MFEVNLNNLSGDAVHLLDLLAFLEPSRIHETILKPGAEPISDLDFDFLAYELE